MNRRTARGPSGICFLAMRATACQMSTLTLMVVVGTSACSSQGPVSAGKDIVAVDPNATIQEFMAGQVDPAADALWDSVAIIVSAAGIEERRPRTEADWKAVRLQALTLMATTRFLGLQGRRVASQTAPQGSGELSPPDIQRRIDADHDTFVRFADALRIAAQQALTAIDARDPQRLMDAGGVIDSACEACH